MATDEALRKLLEACRQRHHPNPPRQAAPLSDVLGRYMSESGLTQRYSLKEIHSGWLAAVGAEAAGHCSITGLRKGVLSVTVDSAAWLQELASFRKREVLAALRSQKGCQKIHDVDIRLGALEQR